MAAHAGLLGDIAAGTLRIHLVIGHQGRPIRRPGAELRTALVAVFERQQEIWTRRQQVIDDDGLTGFDAHHPVLGAQATLLGPELIGAGKQLWRVVPTSCRKHHVEHVPVAVPGVDLRSSEGAFRLDGAGELGRVGLRHRSG